MVAGLSAMTFPPHDALVIFMRLRRRRMAFHQNIAGQMNLSYWLDARRRRIGTEIRERRKKRFVIDCVSKQGNRRRYGFAGRGTGCYYNQAAQWRRGNERAE